MMTTIWSGLTDGALYALVAVGFNIVLTSSSILNFAQGSFVMLGTFVAYWSIVSLRLPVIVSLLVAVMAGAIVGALTHFIAIRPLSRGRRWVGTGAELITTVGIATAISGAVVLIWGTLPLAVPLLGASRPISALGGRVLPLELVIIVLGPCLALIIHLWFRHTTLGLACLASAEDRQAAALRGINIGRLAMLSFCGAGAIGGIAGVVAAPITYSSYSLGTTLALSGFVALALGGLGSQLGCVVGGMVTGLVGALAARYLGGNYEDISTFVLLLVALSLRPTGLFSQRSLRHV